MPARPALPTILMKDLFALAALLHHVSPRFAFLFLFPKLEKIYIYSYFVLNKGKIKKRKKTLYKII